MCVADGLYFLPAVATPVTAAPAHAERRGGRGRDAVGDYGCFHAPSNFNIWPSDQDDAAERKTLSIHSDGPTTTRPS